MNPTARGGEFEQALKVLYSDVLTFVDSMLFDIRYSASAVDIMPKGVNKGAGVQVLSEVLNIPVEKMLGIGDTEGDLSFLSRVGSVCAPANASHTVQSIADYISDYTGAQGVWDIISSKLGIE